MKKFAIGCLVIPVVVIAGLIIIGAHSDKSKQPARPIAQPTSPTTTAPATQQSDLSAALKNGDSAVISEQAMLGVTEDDYKRINQLSNARDAAGLAQMERDGKLFVAAAGTTVKIINAGFLSHEVRIEDGPHAGKNGIIASDFVKRP